MSGMIPLHIKELKPNPWGAYLILADAHDDWHLPAGVRPPLVEVVKAQLAGGGDKTVPAMVRSLLAFVKGSLSRVEVVPDGDKGWIQAFAMIEHEGKASPLPIRLHDGALLARQEGIPLLTSLPALQMSGIRAGETPATAEAAGLADLKRFVMGCLALGRVEDGVVACARLLEVEPRFRESWRAWMGDFLQLKGQRRRAAEEYAAAIVWEIGYGDHAAAARIAEKMGTIRARADEPVVLRSPALVEDFTSDHLNNVLSCNAEAATLPAPGHRAGRARQFAYDLVAYAYPWLHVSFPDTQIWHGATRVCWDVHLTPTTGVQSLALDFGIDFGDALAGKYGAPPFVLVPGWNSLSVPLREPVWRSGDKTGIRFDAHPLEPVIGVQFVFSADGQAGTGMVAITNIRIE